MIGYEGGRQEVRELVRRDRAAAALPAASGAAWQDGHQYVVRGSSPPCGPERMIVPQRWHGRPARS
jgi:hypothetical protein